MNETDPRLKPIEEVLDDLNEAMAPCAGGVEREDLSADGVLRLRFTGMCTGCACRPLTTVQTVRPALASAEGVSSVEIANSRISAEAEERIARAFSEDDVSCRASE